MHCNESDGRRNHQNPQFQQPRTDGELLADTLLRIIGGDDASRENAREGIQSEEDNDDRNRQDAATLEQFAKSQGVWIDNADEYLKNLYGQHFAQGSESFVYRIDKQLIVKTRSFVGYDTIKQALTSIKIHNLLFPETALKIVGLGRSFDEFTAILVQNNIEGSFATKEEIEQFVKERFNAGKDESILGGNSYKNDKYLLQDLKPKNVLVRYEDGAKRFYVVDGDFYYNNN